MSKGKHQKPKRFRKKTVSTPQSRFLRHMHASARRRYLEAFDITAAGTVPWPA